MPRMASFLRFLPVREWLRQRRRFHRQEEHATMTTQATSPGEFGQYDSPQTRNATLLRLPGDAAVDDIDETVALGPEFVEDLNLYKGGSDQWFVTYELGLDIGEEDSCPQVTRVYLSGEICGWELVTVTTRSGARVHGVKIEYQRSQEGHRRRGDQDEYETGTCRFAKIIELPIGAMAVDLRSALPDRYRHALHRF